MRSRDEWRTTAPRHDAKHSPFGRDPRLNRLTLSRKKAEVFIADPSHPSLAAAHFAYTRMAGSVRFVKFSILVILGAGDASEVASSVIERIAVPVIPDAAASRLKNSAMHKDQGVLSIAVINPSSGIERTVRMYEDMPIPLTQPIEIGRIHDGNLPASKGNKTVRWIRRHNSLFTQVVHIQPSTADVMCRHFTSARMR